MLAKVTFQAEMGSYADKVRRMVEVAKDICAELEQQGGIDAAASEHVLRAVRLCKCDLTTQMVREFTELQGVVGGLYAREQGEPDIVAEAIYDHYKPAHAGEECPRSQVGSIVSLSDKLDSVVSGFSVDLEPTGSSDPFGLRRAGNGIVKIAVEALPGLDLTIVINRLLYPKQASAGVHAAVVSGSTSKLADEVDRFLRERMEFYFREVAGLRYDTIRAVLRPTKILQDLIPSVALSRAKALDAVRDTEEFLALASAAKRTRNIRKSAGVLDILSGRPDPVLFSDMAERNLYEAYQSLSQRIEQLSEGGNFEEAFRLMGSIRPSVDRFFDEVLVMTDDVAVRRNRLMLLLRLNEDVFTSLADLAEISAEARPKGATAQ